MKVTVNLTPRDAARLDRLARRSRWTRSAAAAVLIERGCDEDEREHVPPREQLLAG